MTRSFILFIYFLCGTLAYAQNLKLPQDQELANEAKRRFALSVDGIASKNYREAAHAIHWLMKNAPGLYDGLYINGYKAYEELANASTDNDQKNNYLDSMIICYNLKDELYQLTSREVNNKAYRYYKYWKSDRSRIGKGMKAYERAYKDPNQVINNNIVSYMDMIRRYRAYGNDFDDQKVLDIYGQVNEVIDYKERQGEDQAKLNRYREAVNGLLTQIIGEEAFNCDFINENLAPGLDEKEDLKLAKKVFGLLLNRECGDSPYFMKAARIIQKLEPTEGLAKVLAQRYFVDEDFEKALLFYTEALNLSETNDKKAMIHMDLAKMYAVQGKKAEARAEALESAKMDTSMGTEAYTFIANLYMSSFDDCKQSKNIIDDRAVFFAAYDMYQKAGDSQGMANARAQFPTVSQVFEQNLKEGDAVRIGCWIQVSTTIRTRPTE